MKFTQTGVGTTSNIAALRDLTGTGLLPIQAEPSDGATTFRILGRCSPEAPWREFKAAGTAGFLECMSWVPYVQLEVTAGTGTVTVWIYETL